MLIHQQDIENVRSWGNISSVRGSAVCVEDQNMSVFHRFQKLDISKNDYLAYFEEKPVYLLQKKFAQWIISRNATINWPLRSCDLTLLDIFLEIYTNKPGTLHVWKWNIEYCMNLDLIVEHSYQKMSSSNSFSIV